MAIRTRKPPCRPTNAKKLSILHLHLLKFKRFEQVSSWLGNKNSYDGVVATVGHT